MVLRHIAKAATGIQDQYFVLFDPVKIICQEQTGMLYLMEAADTVIDHLLQDHDRCKGLILADEGNIAIASGIRILLPGESWLV